MIIAVLNDKTHRMFVRHKNIKYSNFYIFDKTVLLFVQESLENYLIE